MIFPFNFNDFSLWLALTSIILLISSEMLNPSYGNTGIILERHKLGQIAWITSIIFLAIVALRIIGIILGS